MSPAGTAERMAHRFHHRPWFHFENPGRPSGTCNVLRIEPGIEMPGYCHRVAPRRQMPIAPIVHPKMNTGGAIPMTMDGIFLTIPDIFLGMEIISMVKGTVTLVKAVLSMVMKMTSLTMADISLVMKMILLTMAEISMVMKMNSLTMPAISLVVGMISLVMEIISMVMEMAGFPLPAPRREPVFTRQKRANTP
jgi:hypothetical protein